MGRLTTRMLLLLAASMLVLAACGSDAGDDSAAGGPGDQSQSSPEATESGSESTVTATEYAFDVPETMTAGETTLNLQNSGKEPHEMLVFKINDESALEELLKLPQRRP